MDAELVLCSPQGKVLCAAPIFLDELGDQEHAQAFYPLNILIRPCEHQGQLAVPVGDECLCHAGIESVDRDKCRIYIADLLQIDHMDCQGHPWAFKNLSLFYDLNADELEDVAKVCDSRIYKADEVIMREGESGAFSTS